MEELNNDPLILLTAKAGPFPAGRMKIQIHSVKERMHAASTGRLQV